MSEPEQMPDSDRRLSNKARRKKAFHVLVNVFPRAQALAVLRAIDLVVEKRARGEEP